MEGVSPILPCANEVTSGDVAFILSVVVANKIEGVIAKNSKFCIGKIDWEICTEHNTDDRSVKFTFTCQKSSLSDYWGVHAVATIHFSTQIDDGVETKKYPIQRIEKIEVNATKRSAEIILPKEELYALLPPDWQEQEEATYSVHVAAQLKIGRTWGLRRKAVFSYDFFTQNDLSNLLLIIEGKRVFVDLWYLAHYSAFFAKHTEEKHLSELREDEETKLPSLELGSVDCDAFVELLKIIYPSQSVVTNDNCEKLLIVANYLAFETVLIKCESFLCQPLASISKLKKLQWAFVYQMADLHEYCIKNIHSTEDLVSLKKDDFYKELSCEVKAALLDHLITLVEREQLERSQANIHTYTIR